MVDRPEDYEAKVPAPNGCGVCGHDQWDHASRWHPAAGRHTWQEPTNAHRLARLRVLSEQRRAAAKFRFTIHVPKPKAVFLDAST